MGFSKQCIVHNHARILNHWEHVASLDRGREHIWLAAGLCDGKQWGQCSLRGAWGRAEAVGYFYLPCPPPTHTHHLMHTHCLFFCSLQSLSSLSTFYLVQSQGIKLTGKDFKSDTIIQPTNHPMLCGTSIKTYTIFHTTTNVSITIRKQRQNVKPTLRPTNASKTTDRAVTHQI